MRMLRGSLLAIAASLLLAGAGFAQNDSMSKQSDSMSKQSGTMGNENTKSTANGGVATKDNHFMQKAAQGGMAEVELGQLAQQNGQSQEVKDFGKKMVDDHGKANDELKQVASQQGVSLPTTMDAKDQALKDKLSKMQGAEFDKAYMQAMVKDHKKDVAEFKKEANSGNNQSVKDFAGKTLPTLESHLQMAESVSGKVGAGTSAGNHMSSGSDKSMSSSNGNTTAQQH
jgi:putative membrane protein